MTIFGVFGQALITSHAKFKYQEEEHMDKHDDNGLTVMAAGATGLVGREILRLLVADEQFGEIRALLRRPLPPELASPRISDCICDFEKLKDNRDWFHVDQVFCALGTTIKKAGSQNAFRRVDFDYPLTIARLAKEQGAKHFLLVSAMGANPDSKLFYNQVKGELEVALQELGYPSLTIARPSLLLGDREEIRLGEAIAKKFLWLMPPKWRGVHAALVAAALVQAAKETGEGVRIIENPELRNAI